MIPSLQDRYNTVVRLLSEKNAEIELWKSRFENICKKETYKEWITNQEEIKSLKSCLLDCVRIIERNQPFSDRYIGDDDIIQKSKSLI